MKVLLDLDGVLANFVHGACRLHKVVDPYDRPENLGKYDIQEILNIPEEDFWKDMGEEFWSYLRPMRHMYDILTMLEGYYGRQNICLLTSPVRTLGCTRGKMRWIEEWLPSYKRQFLIGPMKEVCAHRNSILFDDYHRNIEKFEAAGGNAFLVPAPWNHKHSEHPVDALAQFLGEK